MGLLLNALDPNEPLFTFFMLCGLVVVLLIGYAVASGITRYREARDARLARKRAVHEHMMANLFTGVIMPPMPPERIDDGSGEV